MSLLTRKAQKDEDWEERKEEEELERMIADEEQRVKEDETESYLAQKEATSNAEHDVEQPEIPSLSRPSLNRLNTPFGQRTDGTESAAKVVEEVAHVVESVVEGVKAAVHEAVDWTEKKAESLAHAEDNTGPYDSPATCAISDLDGIGMGILPATVNVQEAGNADAEGNKPPGSDSAV